MPVIGIEKLYYALVTTDTAGSLVFGTPVYLPGIQKLMIKPKQSTEKQWAEDQLWDQSTAFDSCDVEIALADLTSAQQAALLGETLAAAGGVYSKSDDVAPYVAILFKSPIRGGTRYGVLYKGAFTLSEDSMETQEGKVKFQSPVMSAVFQPLKNNKLWRYKVDTTDANCPANIADTWFTAVAVPTADTTAPTVTVSPVDAAPAVAVDANVVWTFSEAIDATKITAANFFVVKASDGAAVAGALSVDETGAIVTFNPTSNLDAGTAYIAFATKNITDLSGNALAATSVINFTTAS